MKTLQKDWSAGYCEVERGSLSFAPDSNTLDIKLAAHNRN